MCDEGYIEPGKGVVAKRPGQGCLLQVKRLGLGDVDVGCLKHVKTRAKCFGLKVTTRKFSRRTWPAGHFVAVTVVSSEHGRGLAAEGLALGS